jgi:lysophospholipase L1-like esterase
MQTRVVDARQWPYALLSASLGLWLLLSACGGGSSGASNEGGASGSGGQSGVGASNGGGAAAGTSSSGAAGSNAAAGSNGAGGSASGSSGSNTGAAGASGSAGAGAGGAGSAGGGAGGLAGSGAGLGGASAGHGGMGNAGSGGKAGSSGGGAGGASGGAGGATNLPATTVWIAGDSTVMTYPANNTDGDNGANLEGWGQELAPFFTNKVTVNNQAIGGRSVAFFTWTVATDSTGAYECDSQGAPTFRLTNGNKVDTSQWAKIKSGIKAGDFLLIQFGTNDETHDCPRFVSTADFETDLGFMADTVIAKGATPIFVTPMGHRTFTGTKFNNTLLPYANAMKAEASAKGLEVVDLNLRSGEYYESVGTAYLATNIFDGGTTHFIKAGAIEMATLIVGELKKNNGPLAAYLK